MKFFILLFSICFTPWAQGAIPYRLSIDDSQNFMAEDRQLILANLDAAISDWARFIKSNGEVWIQISVVEHSERRLNGGSTGNTYYGSRGGVAILEESGTYKLRTGQAVNPKVPDISINISFDYLKKYLWVDPDPTHRNSIVPNGKLDLVTAFAHELGHGFGIQGWIDPLTGRLPAGLGMSVYDSYIFAPIGQFPTFTGAKATKIYGSNPPVTFFSIDNPSELVTHDGVSFITHADPNENFYHLGRFISNQDESNLSFFSLMRGAFADPNHLPIRGLRALVNELDASVLEDLGVPPVGSGH